MRKKILSVFSVLVCVVMLVGCGKKTLEKFLRDVRGRRKEMASEAGAEQVELA